MRTALNAGPSTKIKCNVFKAQFKTQKRVAQCTQYAIANAIKLKCKMKIQCICVRRTTLLYFPTCGSFCAPGATRAIASTTQTRSGNV